MKVTAGQNDAEVGVIGISCYECEYGREGSRIRSGGLLGFDGTLRGNFVRIVRHEKRVTERTEENDDKSDAIRREVLRPYGITEQINDQEGAPELRERKLVEVDFQTPMY